MSTAPAAGLGARLRGLGATALGLLQTRLELFLTELEEEKIRLGSVLIYAAAAFFFIGFGVVLLALFLTVLLWDTQRLLALGVFTSLFLIGGIVTALLALRNIKKGSHLFAASLVELAQDRNALHDENNPL